MEKIIRISVDKKSVEETLYAAMVSESERLKNTFSRSERNEIRDFIVQCFRLLEAAFQENEKEAHRADSETIGTDELAGRIPTGVLADELSTRRCVEERLIEPYAETTIKVSGPARVFIVTD